MEEGKALQAELARHGIEAFLCDVAPGGDIARTVIYALDNCQLVVILGTVTYGEETASKFSTFNELRHIINEEKPFFLVKMCDRFAEAETRFHLSSNISYHPWQPAGAERTRVPSTLVDQIILRLASIQRGVASSSSRPATLTAPAAAKTASHSPFAAATPAAADKRSIDLADWLASLSLTDFQPALQAVGAETLEDVQFAISDGFLSASDLTAQGLSKLRVARFLKEAAKVNKCFARGYYKKRVSAETSHGEQTAGSGTVMLTRLHISHIAPHHVLMMFSSLFSSLLPSSPLFPNLYFPRPLMPACPHSLSSSATDNLIFLFFFELQMLCAVQPVSRLPHRSASCSHHGFFFLIAFIFSLWSDLYFPLHFLPSLLLSSSTDNPFFPILLFFCCSSRSLRRCCALYSRCIGSSLLSGSNVVAQ